jgi:tRNA(Ile)-lysidine synthase TilS/MesJ
VEEAKQPAAVVKASTTMVSQMKCFKCKVNAPNFTNKQDKVCKECFLDILVHKFKSSLRQNLKIWKDDLNLVCISGGSNSMGMLNMLYKSLFGNQSNRKMFFRVHILYIDEGPVVYGHSEEQHAATLSLISEVCKSYQFSYTILPLESIYDLDCPGAGEAWQLDMRVAEDPEVAQKIEEEKKRDEEEHTQQDDKVKEVTNVVVHVENIEEKRKQLRELMECLPTISNFREDMILYLKRWLIVAFALKYNFKKVLFGTTGHKVAT